MIRADASFQPETRREEKLVQFHHGDERQSIQPPNPLRLKQYGGRTALALLTLLNYVTA